jgi:hypothetical protein
MSYGRDISQLYKALLCLYFLLTLHSKKRVISCNVDRELKVKSNIFLYGGIKHCTDT